MAERYNVETAEQDNREPGILIVQGSNYAKEMAKFEQFPSKYGETPGNPYQYRPFPKMVYKADLWQGKALCLAAAPDPSSFPNPNDFHRVEEQARRFNEKCQRTVMDESELQKALEMGYRESPADAVSWLEAKREGESRGAAERAYADRNMSEPAKAEAKAAAVKAFDEEGSHLPAVPEAPIKRRRGRPRKNPEAA
jgi:hypothetical protein